MKYTHAITALSVLAFTTSAHAAAGSHVYANAISANNIIAINQSIMSNAMLTFEGTAAAALGTRAHLIGKNAPAPTNREYYGNGMMYGHPSAYGEPDVTIAPAPHGRNGGDMSRPIVNSLWFAWQHYDDDVKFHDMHNLDSEYDLLMLGLGGGHAQMGAGISSWGMYSGYVGGTQSNARMNLDEDGGYVGIYAGYSIGGFNLSTSVSGGALYNHARAEFGTDEYANIWAGMAARASYNIAVTDTFTFQPNLYAGYTWIKSANYISKSGAHIANKHFNTFQLAPGLRLIKHWNKGWFTTIYGKYAIDFEHGGTAAVSDVKIHDLETDDYAEYGIGIEKSIDRFNIAVNIGRRDGGRTGWNGGFNLKYIF